jgi:peroxiredoxin
VREFTEFGNNQQKFDDMNIEVLGISRDLAPAQQKFKEFVNAKNTFLTDPEAKVIGAYGALNANKIANRYYFLIDENGKLIWKSVTGQLIPVEKLVDDLSQVVKK